MNTRLKKRAHIAVVFSALVIFTGCSANAHQPNFQNRNVDNAKRILNFA